MRTERGDLQYRREEMTGSDDQFAMSQDNALTYRRALERNTARTILGEREKKKQAR